MKKLNLQEFFKSKPKHGVVVLDIEMQASLAAVWGIWNQNVPLSMLLEDGYMLCFAAKWLGSKEYYYIENRHNDDKEVVEHAMLILDNADFMIAHNANFDFKTIRTRALNYGIAPHSPIKLIDTLAIAKKEFRLTSNKLEYLAKFLKVEQQKEVGHSGFEGYTLWKEAVKGNNAAWQAFHSYNLADIVCLEQVYMKLRPWSSNHPVIHSENIGKEDSVELRGCPKCGSDNLRKNGGFVTKAGIRKQRLHCKDCNSWFISSKSIKSKNVERLISC